MRIYGKPHFYLETHVEIRLLNDAGRPGEKAGENRTGAADRLDGSEQELPLGEIRVYLPSEK